MSRFGQSFETIVIREPTPLEVRLGKRVAIHEHGELGPILGDPAHDFTGPSDLKQRARAQERSRRDA